MKTPVLLPLEAKKRYAAILAVATLITGAVILADTQPNSAYSLSSAISSLRILKSAVLMYVADNGYSPLPPRVNHFPLLLPYLADSLARLTPYGDSRLFYVTNTSMWVGSRVTLDRYQRNRLADRAKTERFYGSQKEDEPPPSPDVEHLYHPRDKYVWLYVGVTQMPTRIESK